MFVQKHQYPEITNDIPSIKSHSDSAYKKSRFLVDDRFWVFSCFRSYAGVVPQASGAQRLSVIAQGLKALKVFRAFHLTAVI
jgi:hypothetical protein